MGRSGYLWGSYGAWRLLIGQLWGRGSYLWGRGATYGAAMGQGELLMGQGGYLWGSCASPTGPPPPDVGDVTLSPPHALPHGAMGRPTTAAVELKLKGAPPSRPPPAPHLGTPSPTDATCGAGGVGKGNVWGRPRCVGLQLCSFCP